MHVQVLAVDFPGRSFECFDGIRVGFRVGDELNGVVCGDAGRASWETDVRVREVEDGCDFTGPAVRGRRGDRALGLVWMTDTGEVFRAAKLRLDRVPPEVVAAGLRAGAGLIATVRMTDARGGPICASVPPSHILWRPAPAP